MKIPQDKLLGGDVYPSILGQNDIKKQLTSALLSERHVLILGAPGVGKTTLAKDVAKLLPEVDGTQGEDRFVRVQGSPDLTVEDLLGDIDPIKALEFGPTSKEAFTPGKIFKANNGVLFFDELNRAPEKLQNALLQVLQEGYATIGSYDVDFPTNFVFIATMNPEDSSTEKVSEVLLDRFDVIYMGYPEDMSVESQIVRSSGKQLVTVEDNLLTLMVGFVRLLRQDKRIEKKPSVRASIGLYERSQAQALIEGRSVVNIEDVKAVYHSVLAHRISLKPSMKYSTDPNELLAASFRDLMESEGRHLDDSKEGP